MRGNSLRALVCSALLMLAAAPLAAQQTAERAIARRAQLLAAQRDSLVAFARAQIGRRYRYSGDRPEEGFDCSGLVRYLLEAFDLHPPRTAALQALLGRTISRDTAALRPGDLLTFGNGDRISHIGIYVGGGRFIHASSAAGRVVESRVDRPTVPGVKPWRGARRILGAIENRVIAAN